MTPSVRRPECRPSRRSSRRRPTTTIATCIVTWTHVIAIVDRGLFAVPAWVAEAFMDRGEPRSHEHLREAIGYLRRMFDIDDPTRVEWAGTAADALKLLVLGKVFCGQTGMPPSDVRPPERTDLAPNERTRWVITAPVGSSEEAEYPRDVDEQRDEEARLLARYLALYGVRNTVLENFHAGKGPTTQTGDYVDVAVHTPAGVIPWANVSRITDPEMRALMLDVETQLAHFVDEILRRERGGTLPRLLARIRRDHFGHAGISWDRPRLSDHSSDADRSTVDTAR